MLRAFLSGAPLQHRLLHSGRDVDGEVSRTSECGKMDSGSDSLFSHIFFLFFRVLSVWRDGRLTGRPVLTLSRETRALCIIIKLTLYRNKQKKKKTQTQSRTRYEREKEMNGRPARRLTVKYSSSPTPIMHHACAWWRENDCPTSLLILPFLSSPAPKNRARLCSRTCKVLRAAYFGQTQHVIYCI